MSYKRIRAILTYLAETYGKNDSIYPKDPKIRAQIARLQFFDLDTLFARLYAYMSPVFKGLKPDPKDLEKVHESLKWLNSYLEGHFFAVENRITVADFTLIATIGFMNSSGIDLSKYPNISSWFGRCRQQMKGYDKVTKETDEIVRNLLKGKFRN
ncbi:hypothetical protein Anas_08916 [Armadillidium nasatum]|uniref:GST C-terminal domain-containing protein n=1 Tax=Armadillidium nasatum TaxID=96803 RepID=A0A5N5SXF7_9CRUS|nr:hypothetical protein Anas_08916 [Armadillidium nasatum]